MTDTATHLVQTSHLSFNLQKRSAFRITFAKAFRSSVFPIVCLPRMTIAFPYVLFTHLTRTIMALHLNNNLPTAMKQNQHQTYCFSREVNYHGRCNFSQHTCLHFQNDDNLMLLNSCRTHEITAPLFLLGNFRSLQKQTTKAQQQIFWPTL